MEIEDIKIRPMLAADYAAAIELWSRTEAIDLNESDTEAAIHAYLKRNPEISAVATLPTGDLVGVVLCGHNGRRGAINHLAVEETYRGRGIAKKLLQHCYAKLAEEKIRRCHIYVYSDSTDGIEFWLHDGWKDPVTWKVLQRRIDQ